MVTTAATATGIMQTMEYHVKYNTTTHLKQTTAVVGGRVNLKMGTTIVISTTSNI
jgi:hypothetical protein